MPQLAMSLSLDLHDVSCEAKHWSRHYSKPFDLEVNQTVLGSQLAGVYTDRTVAYENMSARTTTTSDGR